MTVCFSSLNDVREFVSLATRQPYPVLVLDGERSVNAESFMEMFTLNLTAPLTVSLGEHEAAFAALAKKFLR